MWWVYNKSSREKKNKQRVREKGVVDVERERRERWENEYREWIEMVRESKVREWNRVRVLGRAGVGYTLNISTSRNSASESLTVSSSFSSTASSFSSTTPSCLPSLLYSLDMIFLNRFFCYCYSKVIYYLLLFTNSSCFLSCRFFKINFISYFFERGWNLLGTQGTADCLKKFGGKNLIFKLLKFLFYTQDIMRHLENFVKKKKIYQFPFILSFQRNRVISLREELERNFLVSLLLI